MLKKGTLVFTQDSEERHVSDRVVLRWIVKEGKLVIPLCLLS